MLTIGANSYVDAETATTYVSDNYSAMDALRVKWEEIDTPMKNKYLRRAASQIDSLILAGRKVEVTQGMEFPRAIPSFSRGCSVYYVQDEVPQEVKDAQIEQALELAMHEGQSVSERQKLAEDGVTQYSIGSLSETINIRSRRKLRSEVASELMKQYTLGGVRI